MARETVAVGPKGLRTMAVAFKAEGARLRDADWRTAIERVRALSRVKWAADYALFVGADAALDALLAAMEGVK